MNLEYLFIRLFDELEIHGWKIMFKPAKLSNRGSLCYEIKVSIQYEHEDGQFMRSKFPEDCLGDYEH